MKKIIIVILCFGMAFSASAQSAESSSNVRSGANAIAPQPYHKVMFTYSPLSLKTSTYGTVGVNERIQGVNNLGLTYMHGSPLASFPLYLEYGGGLQYTFYHNKAKDVKYDVVSIAVPVNMFYRFAFDGGRQHIAPYAGIYGRYNVWGKEGDYFLFGEDDFVKRFQFGWQVGLQYDISRVYLQIAYISDITNCYKGSLDTKTYLGGFNFGIGVVL